MGDEVYAYVQVDTIAGMTFVKDKAQGQGICAISADTESLCTGYLPHVPQGPMEVAEMVPSGQFNPLQIFFSFRS